MELTDLDIHDLGLELEVPPSRGRRAKSVVHQFERELDEEDIGVLLANPSRGSEPPAIQRLKQSHHRLAQLLAEGVPDVEASLITGYTQSRISILKADPAFSELLAHYSGVTKEIFINVHERLAGLGLDALEELHQRLEEAPEKLSNKELMDLAQLGFDRSGYGPKSTQVNEFKFSTDGLLSSVREEIRKKSNGNIKTLDIRANRPRTQDSAGEAEGFPAAFSPREHSPLPPSGSEGGREAVGEAGREEAPSPVVPLFPGKG